MADTTPSLHHLLQMVWESGVAKDYAGGQFGTERGLQACFYFHLRTLVCSGAERVFVEPRIVLSERVIIPDLCIVGEHEGWLVELKLQNTARQGVVWETDFQKFAAVAKRAGMGMKLESRGDFNEILLPPNMYFLFAAIGDRSCGALSIDWLRGRAADHLQGALQQTYWAGGVVDKKQHFEGPISLVTSSRG